MICNAKRLTQRLGGLGLSAVLAAALALVPASAQQRQPDVAIGWTTWGDAEVVSKLATVILQQGMNKDVELTLADIAVQYRGVANGDLDAMLMSWQPLTHKTFLDQYSDRLTDLGPIYEGADLGLVVPASVPESQLDSVADLAKADVREKLSGRIQGISANSGVMEMARDAADAYGFDYELQTGTGPKMAQELGKAIDRDEWIVATGWRPHWKFDRYKLRYLKDPKGVFGGSESVHAVVNKGFEERQPAVAGFLRRLELSIAEVEALMASARQTNHRQAIHEWIKSNRDRVDYWMSGEQ
ncbi:glycine betaine ABC transporter substrate-binding protein [Salicola sp. Rm-C-2C1-2]|uniref:glycine betaine ABC transporter substrate-binding protein n=1 Tax=Salicola sp. Rm-C-2C1-2 TaxID=3141321 RepID=UPI0032E46AB4